ncbi:MAG: InlB B-repeat-containing protein [Parabacteroides sp.]
MKRMIIDVVRRLAGGKLAQQATQTRMSAAGHDVARSEVSLCQRKGTLVPTIGNRFAIGLAPFCHRLGTPLPSAWHAFATGLARLCHRLGTASFSPHLALRSLLLITMILGGVLESGAATTGNGGKVTSISGFSSALGGKVTVSGNTVTLTDDINLNATLEIALGNDVEIVFNLNGKIVSRHCYNDKAVAVTVTSGHVVITGGGTIKAHSQYKVPGVKAYDAVAIAHNGGTLSIQNATFIADPFDLAYAYTIDPNIGTLNGLIPYGAYIQGASLDDYNSTGYPHVRDDTVTSIVSLSTYTATFNPNGGVLAGSSSVQYTIENISPFKVPAVTRKGYNPAGWSVTPDTAIVNGVPVLKDRAATGTITYTAQWTPIPYTIKYTGLEGADQTADYDITKDLSLPQPTKLGYTFKGWKDKNGNIVSGITYDAVSSNAENGVYTLTAQWEINTYTITYKSEGQIISNGANPATYQIGNTMTLQNLSDKDGAEFVGWKDTETGQLITALPGDNPRNLTLEAIWSYTYKIEYITDTSETITDNTTHKTNEAVDLSSPQVNKNGYTFSHWEDQKGNVFTDKIPANTYTKEDKTVTLTAVWTAETYKLTFNAEGFAGYPKEVEFTVESEEIKDFPQLDKQGYIFNGWYNGTEKITSIDPAHTFSPISLTAKWKQITYNLVYKYNLGGFEDQSDSYTVETYASKSLPVVAKRNDYDFAGWYMNGVKQDVVPFDWEIKQTPIAFTLEAKWTVIPYAVKFDLNYEGGGMLEGDQYTYNAEQGMENLPDKTVATRTGYMLKGWYENAQGTGEPVTKIPAGTGEKILYAQWTPNTYTITYYWNGGDELSSAPATFVYNVGATLPTAEEMRKDHYTFAGWTRDPSSSNYVGRVEASCCAENQTFYAQWVPATYTLQFNTNGGTTVADLNYLYGSEVALKKSYRNGYAFGGWYADADLTKPVGEMVTSVTIPDNAPKTLTFYAQWNPIQYTITYDTYGGTIQSGRVDTYRTGEEVMLPTDVRRDGFSFAGWYKDDMLTTLATKIEAGDYGDKTFYATWSRGFSVIIAQPKEGVISVRQGDQSIASGTPLAKGTELTISAEPTTSGYVLKELVINDKEYTTSPQTVTIGEENLIVSAEFVASTLPVVPAPTITTDPDREKVDAETLVKVTLAKTDEASTLYYALNEQQARLYEGLFMVDGSVGDTVTIRAIARREGYSDGVATRQVIFDGRLHLVFDLPAGVTATAPDGGTVVDAIVKGGTFEFKLQVDKDYFVSTDTMQVLANGVLITPGTNGVYRLYDQTGDVKVVVRGLQARQCTVTLLQTEHGQITFAEGAEESSRAIDYGTDLTVQAMADEDYKFSKWSTGSQKNPLTLRVVSDTTLSAQFISDYKAYQITLPEVEGVTVKPFTGYSTEVKRDGMFKFYLAIANGYHEEQLVVRADGEELEKNKGGYALYHVNKNIRISVEGIVRDTFAVTLPPQVKAWKLETMEEATEALLYAETPLLLRAVASEGQRFLKWTDGSTDNPRLATALDARQLYPLFTTLNEAPTAKISLVQTAGAGITGSMSNLDVVNLGECVQVRVIVLPAYSQSEVRLLANGKVVEPNVQLRATSVSKSYYYEVTVSEPLVELKVDGLQLNRYQLTVDELIGGSVSGVPANMVSHGDVVTLAAKPAEGMAFVRWWDGNTLNPYPYVVTGDQVIHAYFVGESSPVDNELIAEEHVNVFSPETGGLWLEVPVPQDVRLWDSGGRLLLHRHVSGSVHLAVPVGIYLLQCGMRPAIKVVVRK